jgi:uncharacterized membrane protein
MNNGYVLLNSMFDIRLIICQTIYIYIYIYGNTIHHLGDDHHSKMTDQNISHFIIFVNYSRIKYIDNLKWLTKIINN